MFLSAGLDIKFHSWPPEDGDSDQTYSPNATSKITHVSWCNDNNYIALLSENGKPEIISTRLKHNVKLVHTIQAVSDVTALAFPKNTKKYLSLGTASAQVALYDTKNRVITKLYANLPSPVRYVDFNAQDQCMGVACADGTVMAYGTDEDDDSAFLKLSVSSQPTALRFHPENSKYLAVASENGEVVLWDIASTRKMFYTQSHTSTVSGLALASSGGTLISVGHDHKICVYDMNIGECLFRNNLQQPLTAVDLNYDGDLLAVGFEDGTLYAYDMRKLIQPVFTCRSHNSRVNKILFNNRVVESEPCEGCASKISSDVYFVGKGAECSNYEAEDKNVDSAIFLKLKKDVVKSLREHVDDLSNKMRKHFILFKDFLENEFATLDNVIEEKCDFLRMTTEIGENSEQCDGGSYDVKSDSS